MASPPPNSQNPSISETQEFLHQHPDVEAVDVILTDLHGVARGKIIRRHELESLFEGGRGMPASLFAHDISGFDVDAALTLQDGNGGDGRCWPVPGTLGYVPATGRGVVLVTMFNADGTPHSWDPRQALIRQIERAVTNGRHPMGAMELEFYLVDSERDEDGRGQAARHPLTGQRPTTINTMSLSELDDLSPFLEALYEGAKGLNLPLETVISEYATSQYELTLRYRDLARAADDIALSRHLIRVVARRFGMEACFMAKPFGDKSGSGMHLHLSLAGSDGQNLFADTDEATLSPLMLNAIGGLRGQMSDSMLLFAPFLNSWRRLASTVYSPASNTWGVENRYVALRIPAGRGETRHFEHRVAGVDSNPYLAAAVLLGGALDGIEEHSDPGTEGLDGANGFPPLPPSWRQAIDRFDESEVMRRHLGDDLHRGYVIVKRHEHDRLITHVTDVEWQIYGSVL